MNKKLRYISIAIAAVTGMATSTMVSANVCDDISYAEFTAAVDTAYGETNQFGFGLPMWATLMNVGGKVCYVYSVKGAQGSEAANGGATSGNNAWLGSRVISAQKANTANQFTIDGLAISTGAISALVYPGGSLYGLQHSNPVDARAAYAGTFGAYGTENDPLVGIRVGGVNVFGGGVAIYDNGVKVGAVGASGDTSCRDHTLAYRLRFQLGLNTQPNDDGLVLAATPAALFEQPACSVNDPVPTAVQGTQEFLATGGATGPFNDASDFGIRTSYVAP